MWLNPRGEKLSEWKNLENVESLPTVGDSGLAVWRIANMPRYSRSTYTLGNNVSLAGASIRWLNKSFPSLISTILWNKNMSHRPSKKQAISELAWSPRSELKLMSTSGNLNVQTDVHREAVRRTFWNQLIFTLLLFSTEYFTGCNKTKLVRSNMWGGLSDILFLSPHEAGTSVSRKLGCWFCVMTLFNITRTMENYHGHKDAQVDRDIIMWSWVHLLIHSFIHKFRKNPPDHESIWHCILCLSRGSTLGSAYWNQNRTQIPWNGIQGSPAWSGPCLLWPHLPFLLLIHYVQQATLIFTPSNAKTLVISGHLHLLILLHEGQLWSFHGVLITPQIPN